MRVKSTVCCGGKKSKLDCLLVKGKQNKFSGREKKGRGVVVKMETLKDESERERQVRRVERGEEIDCCRVTWKLSLIGQSADPRLSRLLSLTL